jgi:beta-xylosidase
MVVRRLLRRLLTPLALPFLLAFTTSAAPPLAMSSLADADFADPFVLRDGNAYYAFATGARGAHVQLARSTDLAAWTLLPDALPSLPSWASRSDGLTWAPSVLRRGRRYVLYYTARDALSDLQCISSAVSDSPAGPYVDSSTRPFVCQVTDEASFCGSIDPSPFLDASGDAFLFWKSDENSARCAHASRIWGQQLTADGLSLQGQPTALLTMDRPWERPLIEGPSMLSADRRYHLFYSANWYESADYAIGYATCDKPLGPCNKVTLDAPLLRSSGTKLGPGGQEFFDDGAGGTLMAYHAWSAPKPSYASGGARTLRLSRVTFGSGLPVFTDAITRP